MKLLKFEKQIGLKMCSWHSGMSSPLYAAGSHIFAGHSISLEQAEEALEELRQCKAELENSTDEKYKLSSDYEKDLAELKHLIYILDRELRNHKLITDSLASFGITGMNISFEGDEIYVAY